MQNSTLLMPSSLLNHLTIIKLALELLERESSLTHKQRALIELALTAVDELAAELPRSPTPWRD
jgi:hypothetical protein